MFGEEVVPAEAEQPAVFACEAWSDSGILTGYACEEVANEGFGCR